MPKLWNDTIDAHRREVRAAILDATAALVAAQGPASVTMAAVARDAGIGRATLYKYFADVDAILLAWHARQLGEHLDRVTGAAAAGPPGTRLEAALRTYALLQHGTHAHHGGDLAVLLHRGGHVAEARDRLHAFLSDLLADAAAAGVVRGDVPPDELATYCLHALTAAGGLRGQAAVRRLVRVTLAGLAGQTSGSGASVE